MLYTWLTALTFHVEKAVSVKFWHDFRCFKKCSANSENIYFEYFMIMQHCKGTLLSLQTTWSLLKIVHVDLFGQVLDLLSFHGLCWPSQPLRYLWVDF